MTNCHLVQIGKRSASLTLWTERGAARHAKMLNSDRAWDVFELLEETFFRIVKPHSASLSPFLQIKTLPRVQRERLNELVLSKIAHIPPHLVENPDVCLGGVQSAFLHSPLLPTPRSPDV